MKSKPLMVPNLKY